MEGENSGGKMWNGLVRYFYQKISPSQLFAIMILVGLCSNDREATDLLEPGNDYGMASNSDDDDATSEQNVFGYFLEKLRKVGGFCYERITVNDITTFMRQNKWGAQYADAVTEIHERRQRNQNAPGSTDPNPGEEGNAPLLTDPVTEGEIAKEILMYLREKVSSEDILTLLKATRWSGSYAGYIQDFIKSYQSQNRNSSP